MKKAFGGMTGRDTGNKDTRMTNDISRKQASFFHDILSSWATGVSVITGRLGQMDAHEGLTISSFALISDQPPLVSFCLNKGSKRGLCFDANSPFAVNILAATQEHFAELFASGRQKNWSDIEHGMACNGVPVLTGCVAHIACEVEHHVQGGDHTIIIGKVLDTHVDPKEPAPMIYFRRDFTSVARPA
jgi:flavin reductase (DIM6/NTAB) family NADH-FMN oxidoreductase RutF